MNHLYALMRSHVLPRHTVWLLFLLMGFASFSAQAQLTTTCKEYVYINEPNGITHKMLVNPADGTLTEVGGVNGTPWLNNASEFPFPHGLGVDRNGFLYVGSNFQSPNDIRKLDCRGNIFPESNYRIPALPASNNWGLLLTSIQSFDGFIYANGPDTRIYKIDPCTGTTMGFVQFAGNSDDWGLHVDQNGKFYVTQPTGKIYAFTPTAADFTANTTFPPFIDLDANPSYQGLSPVYAKRGLQGIVTDNVGNIYVVEGDRDDTGGTPSRLLKFSPTGAFLGAGPIDSNGGDSKGWNQMTGVIYSPESNKLFTTSLNPTEDCIYRWNTDLTADGEAVGPVPNAFGQCKAIGILKECCPESGTVTTAVCDAPVGTRVSLSDLILSNGGVVCEGVWGPTGTSTGLTFNECDLTVTVNTSIACGTFTLTNSGVTSASCPAFTITLNIAVLPAVTAQTIVGDQSVCPTDDPAPFTITTPASGGGGSLKYRWQSSTTSCSAGFTDIPGATSATYDPVAVLQTTYYRVIAFDEGCQSLVCSATSNCATLTLKTTGCVVVIPCSISATATPTACVPATNQYTVSGTISLTSNTAGGTATITDGAKSTTVTVAASATSVAYSLTGLVSDATSHTVTVSLAGCGSAVATYTAPASCSVAPCNLAVTASPSPCLSGTTTYNVTGNITLTNAQPGIYTVTDGTVQTTVTVSSTAATFSVPYTLTGLSGDGLSHTVVVTSTVCGSAVSQAYNAPMCNVPAFVEVSSATVCAGATASLTATGCMSGTINWSSAVGAPGTTPSTGMVVTVATSASITTQQILSYTATCTTVSSTTTAIATVTVSPLPSLTLTANPSATATTGSSVTLTATGCAGGTTTWSTGGADNGKASIVVVAALGSTPYSATCTTPAGCSGTASITVVGTAPVTAGLGDKVFEDRNADGIQQPNEPGIPNVTVTLFGNGTTVTTTTNSSGIYSFMGLTPGVSYTVGFSAPAGFSATQQNIGDDGADSDGNPATGITGPYSLSANELNPTVDMGYIRPASLGDKVFADVNKNGIQDVGDTPIAGVTVVLYLNGVASATTTTASSGTGIGCYSFTGLTPGSSNSYSVGFTTPSGFTATTPNAPGSTTANDSNADPITGRTGSITLASGEYNPTLDAGYVLPESVSVVVTSATVCAGATATLSASGCTGSVTWSTGTSPSTGTLVTVSTAGLTGITATTVLSYTATCTTAGTTTSAVGTVTVNPQPSLTLTATPGEMVMVGGSVTLTATGCTGGSVNWSTGQQNVLSVVVMAGSTAGSAIYSATCVTPSGCTDREEIEIMTLVAACNLAVTAVPGDCDRAIGTPTANLHAVTGLVSATGSVGVTSVTVSSGGTSVVVSLAGNGPASYTLSGLVSDGLVKMVSVASSASVCGTSSTTYTAPIRCSTAPPGQPTFNILKAVNTTRARLGDVLNYTVTVVNTSTVSGSVVATDVLDSQLSYVPNSATVSAGTYNSTASIWTIATLPGSASATLVFSASVLAEGIVYNTASIDSKTVSVCTTIPVRVCVGSDYAFSLGVATGSNRYQWYKDDVLIQDNGAGATGPAAYTGTSPNALLVTTMGAYRVVVNEGVSGQCPDLSCCPFIVEEVSLPTGLTLTAAAPTCIGTVPQTNGKVVVTGLGNSTANVGLTYQVSTGGMSFSASSASPVPAALLPANGEIVSNATGGITYFVRVYGVLLADGTRCSVDVMVVVPVANCACPAEVCVPVSIKKTRTRTL